MAEIVVVDKVNDSFQHVHSTILYPHWTLTTSPGYDKVSLAKIKATLLKLKSGNAASMKAKIKGVVEPVSLDALSDTLKALKLPSFSS